MANQLREWIQNDVITPLGQKAGLTGTINASQVKQTIENMPNTEDLRNTIKGMVERNAETLIIPEGVTEIGASVFANFSTLKGVIMPTTLTKIGANAFYSSTNFANNTTVTIPDNVTELGNSCFAYINSFASQNTSKIIIGSGVKIIPDNCFEQTQYRTIELSEGVETINSNAFKTSTSCYVTLPKSLKEVQSSAFSANTNSKYYYKGDLEDWLKININSEIKRANVSLYFTNENGAYYELSGSLTIPSDITKISSYAFYYFTNLTGTLTIPEGVTEIGSGAFALSKISGHLDLPTSLTSIGNYAFQQCDVSSINVKGILTTNAKAFASMQKLTSITLPEGLENIETDFLNNCMLLTNVTIPSSVTNIDYYALRIGSKTNKGTIVMKSYTPPTITTGTFKTDILYRIYVPKDRGDTYKGFTNWSAFADYIFEPNNITFNVDSSLLNNENVLYSIDGGEDVQFTQASFTGENLATLKVTSKSADVTVLVGTTQGGSEIGTVANASTVFTFESDTTIYITKQ